MRSAISRDAAHEEKTSSLCRMTEKESGWAVKVKLRAFLTQKQLMLRSRVAGVIQNLAGEESGLGTRGAATRE